jgi:hypothetical protein
VWPPARRTHPALERKVASLSRREGWEEAATEWMSTMAMELKTKNGCRNQKYQLNFPPLPWYAKCRCRFMTLPPVLLQEQPAVVLLLERGLVSWLSAIDERSEHKDLRGSDRQSVIPYNHGRMGLYCPSLSLPV